MGRAQGKARREDEAQQEQQQQQQEAQPEPREQIKELEKKRVAVAQELRAVEEQIYELETTYLQTSNPMGNAIKGYEGFLGGQKKPAATIDDRDRLFSWSSVTGQLHLAGQR